MASYRPSCKIGKGSGDGVGNGSKKNKTSRKLTSSGNKIGKGTKKRKMK